MKFLELHIFSFLFSKLRIYREKVQNKLWFMQSSQGGMMRWKLVKSSSPENSGFQGCSFAFLLKSWMN